MSIQKGEEQIIIYNILTTKLNIPLPNFIVKQILFMLQPKTIAHNSNFKDELHLEKSFRLIDKKIYYNGGISFSWSQPKGLYSYEAMSLIMSKKKIIWHNKNDLTYVYNNLKKCGCCERHSCGVTMDPHNTNIKTHKTYRTRLQNLYSPADTDCKCCCRHYMRFILRKFPQIEPKPQIFNILEEMANEEIMTI